VRFPCGMRGPLAGAAEKVKPLCSNCHQRGPKEAKAAKARRHI
jgi:hypothetical protein